MKNMLWEPTTKYIKEKYKIRAWFDLRPYDYTPQLFNNILKPLSGYNFAPNERVVITHTDTQYYMPSSKVSFTLRNLHAALSHFLIPTEMILFFTNQYGIEEELNFLAQEFNFENPIKPIVSFYDVVGTTNTVLPIDLNENEINFSYSCLNGIERSHRSLLLSLLKENNLLDHGLVSTNFNKSSTNSTTIDTKNIDDTVTYLTITHPFRYNPQLRLDQKSLKILHKHSKSFSETDLSHPALFGQPNDDQSRWQPSFLQNALVYVVSETVADYPYTFMTEKTFKGILVKRPMLIAGTKNSLATLRKLGFKTWDKWWDESYDSYEYFYQRANAIIQIIKQINNYSLGTQRKICLEMKEVLEYNFQHYVDNFCGRDYDNYLQGL